MIRKIIGILLMAVAVLFSWQCSREGGSNASDTTIKIKRYDYLQCKYLLTNDLSALQKMNRHYPQATKLLIEDVLAIGEVDEHRINDKMLVYFSDTTLTKLMRDVEVKFKNLDKIESQLSEGFARLKRDVPALPVPRFYTQISALNQSIVVGDSILGISLDKYMGEDYPLYKNFYYKSQRYSMNPDRIVPDCFVFYLLSQYPHLWATQHSLLDVMMHRGKIYWIVSQILKYDTIEDLMGYSKKDAAWCINNRKNLWKMMKDRNHLEAIDPLVIRSYMQVNSYIHIMGKDTPPAIGIWMGMQLIDTYMKKHKELTYKELLEKTDYHQMMLELEGSF